MNRPIAIFAFSILAAVTFLVKGQTKVVVNIPSYVFETTTTYQGLGTRADQPARVTRQIHARRPDGLTMWGDENSAFKGSGPYFRIVTFPDGGQRSAIDLAKAVTTIAQQAGSSKYRPEAPKDLRTCMGPGETLAGEVTLFGVKMWKVATSPGADERGDMERAVWLEGGCLTVESAMTWRNLLGQPMEKVSMRLDYLNLTDNPPAHLFDVPFDYEEMSDTEAQVKAYSTLGPDKVPKCWKDKLASGSEFKMYRKFGPGPGGLAEKFVKDHGFKAPSPNSDAMTRVLAPDPPKK